MFDFAISQQRRQLPSRRFIASLVVSCLSHAFVLAVLIEYPQLLGTGLNKWIRMPVFFTSSSKEPTWRTVALVGGPGKMNMPSAESLKKYTYDWEAHKSAETNAPIRIRWGGEIADSRTDRKEPLPVPRPVPGTQEPAPEVAGAANPPALTKAEDAAVNPSDGERPAGKTATVYLPPPQTRAEPKQIPQKTAETAGNTTPNIIPNPAQPATINRAGNNAQTKIPAPQIFENEQKAIRTEGSGFFDTKGFPLGEYASAIIERIKGNWLIPSNLRSSQGRTTVIFFIDKDGHSINVRIVAPSGSNSLDLAALNAILGSNPFPPLPKGFPGEQVGAKFVFSYNERQ